MKKHLPRSRSALVILAILTIFVQALLAKDIILRVNAEEYQNANLKIQNSIEIIAEEDNIFLARCDATAIDIFNEYGFEYEVVKSSEHFYTDDLSPEPESGLPLAVVSRPGYQGMAGWHEGLAKAGSVLAYMELHVDGQLPGFTFWDMEKDSTWYHPIDVALDSDEPLFMAASDNKICYAFHYNNPEIHNSDMRWYWYDVSSDEHGEVENFGYGFEGFGISDTWMMRVGNKGMGWNNQILAHNIETGERFEIVADSVDGGWGYNYDNLGGPRTDGNTVVYTYTDYSTYTPDLKVLSLGADGAFGTADDIHGTLSQSGGTHTATGYGQYRVSGRYIAWVERIDGDDGNIKAYDMGPDELYGTADDVGTFDVCLDPAAQGYVRIDGDIVIWQDKRNTSSGDEIDIYGYDISTSTEFRSTMSAQVMSMTDLVDGEVLLVKADLDNDRHNDIYFMNIYGIVQGDYYHIDLTGGVPPMARSYLTGSARTSPMAFSAVVGGAKGPLSAVFIEDDSPNNNVIAYSAITGDWSTKAISWTSTGTVSTSVSMEDENAMILSHIPHPSNIVNPNDYKTIVYNGQSGAFSSDVDTKKPTGFDSGKNISMVWADDSTYHWIQTYDAELNSWDFRSANTNDPWHVILTDFSDSLALLVHGQGDTLCSSVGVEAYDLELHDWVPLDYSKSFLREVNRHTYKDDLKFAVNDNFAVLGHDYGYYNDYIYSYQTGDDAWKVKNTLMAYDLEKPLLGEKFILQGTGLDDKWQGHIYNGHTKEWLADYIDGSFGIDGIVFTKELLVAWKNNVPWNARAWAYSVNAGELKQLDIERTGNDFTVEATEKFAFLQCAGENYTHDRLYVFNGLKGEWNHPLEVKPYNRFEMSLSGHTGIYMEWVSSFNGFDELKVHAYSALKDEWDILDLRSNEVDGIFTSDFCGLIGYNHYYHGRKMIHAFNGIDAEWSEDVIEMYPTLWTGLSMNDRIMMVIEDNPSDYVHGKVHVFSPILNMWNSMDFDTHQNFSIDQYMTTPTSAFAWNEKAFRILYSTDVQWQEVLGSLEEIHVTDYAISALINSNWHNFYPPKTEIINEFEITDGPHVDVQSSWAVEVTWKTNMYSDTRLVWAVDGQYGIIEKDTLEEEYTKDHRVLIEGLEANKTYYYGAVSIIANVDTAHSDTLNFNTGSDNTPPALVAAPESYRIHDDQASVWWETNEPSTALIKWGLTSEYTDSLDFSSGEPSLTNAVRMYGLLKDTTYHYQVGGYDRYGNGPFYSGDYTFVTKNALACPTMLQQADSTLYGAAYMTWEPPRYDSTISKETFSNGIPADWKVYNRGDSKKGTSWQSGYSGNNPVAYCSYGESGEHQEEWLISNPITITSTTGGVLNFWHMGFYTEYDNAPNKVMVSWSGTEPEDFSTVWQSQSLPNGDWELVQIDLDIQAHYEQTMYIAFVYESTYGEVWTIDNIYMDWDVDGYYEDFEDLTYWTRTGGHWGQKNIGGNYCIGVDGIKDGNQLPDPVQNWDAWEVSPFIKITESHHILGFWQMGWAGEYDSQPNEVRVVYDASNPEPSSALLRSIYPVPNGWQWTTIDLSAYVGQTIRIGFRYHSNVGWYWNGLEWYAFWGEDWYIDDMMLFEYAPAMVKDPNAKPNEKPMKFASGKNGKPIALDAFTTVETQVPEEALLAAQIPEDKAVVPKERPGISISLPQVTADKAPSKLAEPKPELLGYAVFGRYPGAMYYDYLGYVRSPEFVDWDTYLGQECEYYVEAYYDQGYSQPSNKALIAGGIKYADNEYGYDTGTLYSSYWWYPGNGFSNNFFFEDSALIVEQMKVHIAEPGSFKMSLFLLEGDTYKTVFTSSTIMATNEGWYTVDVPTSGGVFASTEIWAEFYPQDTLVQISYEPSYPQPGSFPVGGLYDGSTWSTTDDIFYIRLLGTMVEKPVAISDIPEEYNLSQNYPNPFNPVTSIEFELPEAGDISLKIYDLRGSLVTALADGHREAGKYQTMWNATNAKGIPVASGIYLLKMTAGEFTATRKMTLLR